MIKHNEGFNTVSPKTKEIRIPGWLKAGSKFEGKWINQGDNVCTVISFDIENNTAEVQIERPDMEVWTEEWNLQHTIWGVENGDYKLIR